MTRPPPRTDSDLGRASGPLPLFDAPPRPAEPARPRMERDFVAFHRANPQVLVEVIRLARDLKARGMSQGAIGLLWEELRRIYAVPTNRPDGEYRLNDHYRAYYARLAMHRAPDLAGFFELRRQRDPFDPATVIDAERRSA